MPVSPRLRLTVAGALALCLAAPAALAQPTPGATLDPAIIPQFVTPLVIPPAMPRTTQLGKLPLPRIVDYYEIAQSQFEQQILPPVDTSGNPLGPTTVWSYESVNHPGTLNYPAFTLEASFGRPVFVKWINNLKDEAGNYLPHLLPVDPTLHWANPPGGAAGRDTRPIFPTTPGPYTGPVPMIPHLHGGHNTPESDGFPEAWFLPDAKDIPAGYAKVGSDFDFFRRRTLLGLFWRPGSVVFGYDNIQDAATLWYHDHTLGMTRTNVYAGPAGFYLLRGGPAGKVNGVLPGPAPARGDPPGKKYFEIPIVIQDRSFDAGTDPATGRPTAPLFYATSREQFDGFPGPYVPGVAGFPSDIAPIWNPEFFGNTIVVNGRTWPFLDVEARRYRFRFLNGSDSRFLMLATSDPGEPAAVPFWQIGGDGGFLPAPVRLDTVLLGPAERADVIVDFTGLGGRTITLRNLAPDSPFGGGTPVFGCDNAVDPACFEPSDPATTGLVMQFRVGPAPAGGDPSTPPSRLVLPAPKALGPTTFTRQVSLNELDSALVCQEAVSGAFVPCDPDALAAGDQVPFGPLEAQLGTLMVDPATGGAMGMPMMWADAITENPAAGATEVWEMWNFTADAHPIHIHEVQFRVVDREPFVSDPATMSAVPSGLPRRPEAGESGYKDTVVAFPGEITRVKALFDRPGKYVWHCHILSHEDNEMMRPFCIGPLANCPP